MAKSVHAGRVKERAYRPCERACMQLMPAESNSTCHMIACRCVSRTHIVMLSLWVCHSLRQLVPFFSTISILNISTKVSPGFVVNIFVEMFKMEIVEKKGTSCRRLVCHGEDRACRPCERACMPDRPPGRVKERAFRPC